MYLISMSCTDYNSSSTLLTDKSEILEIKYIINIPFYFSYASSRAPLYCNSPPPPPLYPYPPPVPPPLVYLHSSSNSFFSLSSPFPLSASTSSSFHSIDQTHRLIQHVFARITHGLRRLILRTRLALIVLVMRVRACRTHRTCLRFAFRHCAHTAEHTLPRHTLRIFTWLAVFA
jgi:hypothetical protein